MLFFHQNCNLCLCGVLIIVSTLCNPARGNTTVCGEFNFAVDPEAAYIVLKEYRCPTYLAGWEFTCYNKLTWVMPVFTRFSV